jgi:hypothetical protein
MDGMQAALLATDPPYLVDYTGGEHPPSKANRGKPIATRTGTSTRDLSLSEVEGAGQYEMLNWIPLIGAMHELRQRPTLCELLGQRVSVHS